MAYLNDEPGGAKQGRGAQDIGPIGPISPNVVQSVAALQEEILRMQQEILYFENRILRKKIAIAELMDQAAAPPPARQGAPERAEGGSPATVREMAEAVLPSITKPVFKFSDLIRLAVDRWPENEAKIRSAIYPAVKELVLKGTVKRVPGGLAKVTDDE